LLTPGNVGTLARNTSLSKNTIGLDATNGSTFFTYNSVNGTTTNERQRLVSCLPKFK
jgi:hypothetical protein